MMHTSTSPKAFQPWLPALIVLIVTGLMVAAVIWSAGGDPLELARLGTRFSQGEAGGTEGYDGQFVYYIARDPRPAVVAPYLDTPAYRYQRILLPWLARLLALGNVERLPWILALLGVLAQAAGTWAVGTLLNDWGVPRRAALAGALAYGLWAGFTLAIRLDLPEPLAYGWVAGALLAQARRRPGLACLLYALALFTKEVTALFLAAQFLADLAGRRWRPALALVLAAGVPYAIFQGWLWWVFGSPGIASGGAMATPFEIVPYLGFLRIGAYSQFYLLAMSVVFFPTILWPSIWGIWQGIKQWKQGERNVIVLGLLLNALVIAFLPFSTFRETGGLIRFGSGLALAVVLYAGRYRHLRALNYSLFWLVLNVFLFK